MARILIVGGGCRGLELARGLVADGHVVRITTRDPARTEAIAQTGAEPFVGDPDRIGTLVDALEHVTLVCWLLGGATGTPEELAALHSTRLDRMLEEVIDTTVRGFVYEAAGAAGEEVLAQGAEVARRACAGSSIPLAVLAADPADRDRWLEGARAAVRGLLVM